MFLFENMHSNYRNQLWQVLPFRIYILLFGLNMLFPGMRSQTSFGARGTYKHITAYVRDVNAWFHTHTRIGVRRVVRLRIFNQNKRGRMGTGHKYTGAQYVGVYASHKHIPIFGEGKWRVYVCVWGWSWWTRRTMRIEYVQYNNMRARFNWKWMQEHNIEFNEQPIWIPST